MAPVRRATFQFVDRHPNLTIIIVVALLLYNILVGTVAFYRTETQINDIQNVAAANRKLIIANTLLTHQLKVETQNRANTQCVSSNDARTALINLLNAAKEASDSNKDATPEQIAAADKFYEKQINSIHIIDCPPPAK